MDPFPATHKTVDVVIVGMHRNEDVPVTEVWTSWNNVEALTQLGHLPDA